MASGIDRSFPGERSVNAAYTDANWTLYMGYVGAISDFSPGAIMSDVHLISYEVKWKLIAG